ncbi:MAG: AAA family ATPase [Thermoplasmata archaeon]|nr:AAA family ATPase [Thermoplasmata archaeon]
MVHEQVARRISNDIEANPGWSLIFGRRKVGKTFLVDNFVAHDVFFTVRIDRSISARGIDLKRLSDLDDLTRVVTELLNEGKTVVIDEFQRLPMVVMEDIARAHPHGKLILTGSSMRVVERYTGRNSPLLALVRPFKLDIIRPSDILASLVDRMSPEKAVSSAPILRDPWTIPYNTSGNLLKDTIAMLPAVVPGLVGEIFTEDERILTTTYSSILSMIGSGVTDHHRIADTLYRRKIIGSGSSSHVIPFMRNMVKMGLLERTPVYKKKKHVYSIPSIPIRMFYYLDSRYDISDRTVDFREVSPAAEGLLRTGIEEFVGDLLAQVVGGSKQILKEAEREVDVLIIFRKRPALVGEVKWGKATKGDISNFLSKVEGMRCRKVLICRSPIETDEVEVLTPDDLVNMAKEHLRTL